jgi:hypothetical protein
MPYTISHAAVVLPFSRPLERWRLLSATVIGSMVPDFGLFSPWRLGRLETHSALSLLTFCLPVGLLAYWIFQKLIKTAVLEVLPEGAYARSRPFAAPARLTDVGQWLRAATGVLAGALTHLVWDAFTHEGARGVRMFPVLDDPILGIGKRQIGVFWVLQDLGSLLGLLVVLALVGYALRRGHESAVPDRVLAPKERSAWVLCYAIGALGLSMAFYMHVRWADNATHSLLGRAYQIAIAGLRGPAAALLLVSLLVDLRLRFLRYRSSGR